MGPPGQAAQSVGVGGMGLGEGESAQWGGVGTDAFWAGPCLRKVLDEDST